MSAEHLATYLNDHLSGSLAGLQMLDHLEKAHAGTEVAALAARLRDEFEQERHVLKSVMETLEIAESTIRKTATWLTAKLTEIKLNLDDLSEGSLNLMESFEALSIGIEGKRLMWKALSTVAASSSSLATIDFGRLEQQASDQRKLVETHRLNAARQALGI